MMRCDEEGVPKLVQSITLDIRPFCWRVILFNGMPEYVSVDIVPVKYTSTLDDRYEIWGACYLDVERYVEYTWEEKKS